MGKRVCAALLTLVLLGFGMVSAFAAEVTPVNASLSCYIHAMGGVEFGAPLLSGAQAEVEPDGSKTMTLFFTKSSVTIYGVTCDTFIDLSPSFVTDTNGVPSGTLGFYEADGTLNTADVTYTLSTDTAQNPQQEQVHYVTSLTFPIREEQETYQLSLFVNSNVMGTQFTLDGYPATLTVDWTSSQPEETEATEPETTWDAPVESKDGLNIYHAQEEAETTQQSAAYIANFKEPLLVAVGVAAGALILLGVILVIAGRKERP